VGEKKRVFGKASKKAGFALLWKLDPARRGGGKKSASAREVPIMPERGEGGERGQGEKRGEGGGLPNVERD